MKKMIYLLCASFLFSCCSKENDNNEGDSPSGTCIMGSIRLTFENQAGEDLLNPNTEGYIAESQLYYLIDGEKIKPGDYDPRLDNKTGTYLITESDPYELRCFLYDGMEDVSSDGDSVRTGFGTSYLELNGEITDTIKAEWMEKIGTVSTVTITKVWINGELRSRSGDVFSIVK